jgi:NitT/TauT family transport system permease protein
MNEVSRLRRIWDLCAPTVTILLMFLIWQILVGAFHVRQVILPAPSAIVEALLAQPGWFAQEGLYTMLTMLIGFGLAVVVGILLAILIVEVKLLESTLYVLIAALNSVPKVAIAPLFVIWLGTGYGPKIAIADGAAKYFRGHEGGYFAGAGGHDRG